MSIPLLYLIDRKTPVADVQQYFEISPVRLVVVTDPTDYRMAYALSPRVLLDTNINGLVARYFDVATETEDYPVAIIHSFQEPIIPLGEQ